MILSFAAAASAAASAAGTSERPGQTITPAPVPLAPGAPLRAEEFWPRKGPVRLWVYRKVAAGAPQRRPVLFFVHGSSYSGKTMFDLQVPGRSGYSLMDHFAERGFDCWTMDHEGYGHSDRTSSYSDIASGVEDLKVAMEVVRQATGADRVAFFGQSSGALRAALFAQAQPQAVERLLLDAFVWTGAGSTTLAARRRLLPELEKSNVRKVDEAFFSSVFTRDEPGAAEPFLGKIVAQQELQYGNTVPNGTYRDMVLNLPVCDPAKISCPVQILRAEHDGIATDEDIVAFYSRLPHPDKQLVKLGGLAHTAILGVNRHRVFHAMHAFLTLPPRLSLSTDAPAARLPT